MERLQRAGRTEVFAALAAIVTLLVTRDVDTALFVFAVSSLTASLRVLLGNTLHAFGWKGDAIIVTSFAIGAITTRAFMPHHRGFCSMRP